MESTGTFSGSFFINLTSMVTFLGVIVDFFYFGYIQLTIQMRIK